MKNPCLKELIMLACMGLVFAAPSIAIAGPQHERMKSCNKDAREQALKGPERKAFMKDCLSNKSVAAIEKKEALKDAHGEIMDQQAGQSDKMKSCKHDAKGQALKGDERKAFIKECLKG